MNLPERARKAAHEIFKTTTVFIARPHPEEWDAIILSCLEEAVKERDGILQLLTYSYRVNGGLKESIDGALSAGSDIDVPISGGLIKQAFEVLATESRPTKE